MGSNSTVLFSWCDAGVGGVLAAAHCFPLEVLTAYDHHNLTRSPRSSLMLHATPLRAVNISDPCRVRLQVSPLQQRPSDLPGGNLCRHPQDGESVSADTPTMQPIRYLQAN